MPNHCQNRLEITGPDDELEKFYKSVCIDEENLFEFNGVVPMPEPLKGTTAPCRIVSQEEYNKDSKCGITQEMRDNLIQEFGHDNWYDWAIANWGTKWGAYDAGDWQYEPGDDEASVYFQTAWAPPSEFLRRASIIYPDLQFHNTFLEEGMEYIGFEIFSNGELVDSANYDSDDEEAEDIFELFGYEKFETEED